MAGFGVEMAGFLTCLVVAWVEGNLASLAPDCPIGQTGISNLALFRSSQSGNTCLHIAIWQFIPLMENVGQHM